MRLFMQQWLLLLTFSADIVFLTAQQQSTTIIDSISTATTTAKKTQPITKPPELYCDFRVKQTIGTVEQIGGNLKISVNESESFEYSTFVQWFKDTKHYTGQTLFSLYPYEALPKISRVFCAKSAQNSAWENWLGWETEFKKKPSTDLERQQLACGWTVFQTPPNDSDDARIGETMYKWNISGCGGVTPEWSGIREPAKLFRYPTFFYNETQDERDWLIFSKMTIEKLKWIEYEDTNNSTTLVPGAKYFLTTFFVTIGYFVLVAILPETMIK